MWSGLSIGGTLRVQDRLSVDGTAMFANAVSVIDTSFIMTNSALSINGGGDLMANPPVPHKPMVIDTELSVRHHTNFGGALIGSQAATLSMMAPAYFGSSMSLRSFSRMGKALSVLEYVNLGSSLSVRGYFRTGMGLELGDHQRFTSISVFDHVTIGSSLSVRSYAHFNGGFSVNAMAHFGGQPTADG